MAFNSHGVVRAYLRPIGGPLSCCRRMRVLAGGQVLQYIDMFNRVYAMLIMFGATDSRKSAFGPKVFK